MGRREPAVDLLGRGRTALNGPLGSGQIGDLVREIAPFVVDASVIDVHGLPPRDLVFVLQPAGSSAKLRWVVSADADGPRLFLAAGRWAKHDGPQGPFFRRCAAEWVGARLASLTQVAGDRIVRAEFHRDGERRCLIAELVGRHSNLLLTGPGERLIDWLVPPPAARETSATSSASSPRLSLGEAWRAPPGRARDAAASTWPAGSTPAPELQPGRSAPLSWIVENDLGAELAALRRDRAVKDLRERLERRQAKAVGLVQGLEQRRQQAEGAERVRQDGDLLKASIGQIARGAAFIDLLDYYSEGTPTRRVTLDPKRSPQENVAAYFDRFHKLERSAAEVEHELELARAKLDSIRGCLDDLAKEESDPAAIEVRALASGAIAPPQEADVRKRRAPEPRKPYREFRGSRGSAILVGRSARDNDELTLRVARGNDVWLHTRDTPGSHVVLRVERGGQPDAEELLDAATLAVHFSPLCDATKAAVHVARRKEVHKPRGAKPGLVALSGGKTLEVRMQPERVKRLLSTARSHPPDADGSASRT